MYYPDYSIGDELLNSNIDDAHIGDLSVADDDFADAIWGE